MTEKSDRFGLPLLAVGQAQKEVTHNEALALIDVSLNPVVQSVAPMNVPLTPLVGQCWIVGSTPTGAWAGQSGAIAGWTAGGWRFVPPVEGMSVWNLAESTTVRRSNSLWVVAALSGQSLIIGGNQVVSGRLPAISAPSGGTVIDSEARLAINNILDMLRTHGLIAP